MTALDPHRCPLGTVIVDVDFDDLKAAERRFFVRQND
jgi:hypothetical protein